ncbi:MAG TPA: glycosyltransferase [Methanomicrobiales archaeon]|jgi:glycosyltransferase involved in cell wall biosynthesis|nr:glycosyltransferase [Methanomicrobiales archaeon]
MITAVVPTFNEEKNIVACLVSLNRQTIPRSEYEIIVVDGNSADRTRELAAPLADLVFVQTSPRVGGARNDGAMRAKGEIVAFADADCVVPPDWLLRIRDDFARYHPVEVYGTVYPLEGGLKNRIALGMANTFARLGYYTRTLYYSLGCNTAVDRDAFIRAGMYRPMDAGEDIEISLRMKQFGKVLFDPKVQVGFSMRRYEQFGTVKSIYQWLYIVWKGGESSKYSYSRREYGK